MSELGGECEMNGCGNAAWNERRQVDGSELYLCGKCADAYDVGRAVGQEEA